MTNSIDKDGTRSAASLEDGGLLENWIIKIIIERLKASLSEGDSKLSHEQADYLISLTKNVDFKKSILQNLHLLSFEYRPSIENPTAIEKLDKYNGTREELYSNKESSRSTINDRITKARENAKTDPQGSELKSLWNELKEGAINKAGPIFDPLLPDMNVHEVQPTIHRYYLGNTLIYVVDAGARKRGVLDIGAMSSLCLHALRTEYYNDTNNNFFYIGTLNRERDNFDFTNKYVENLRKIEFKDNRNIIELGHHKDLSIDNFTIYDKISLGNIPFNQLHHSPDESKYIEFGKVINDPSADEFSERTGKDRDPRIAAFVTDRKLTDPVVISEIEAFAETYLLAPDVAKAVVELRNQANAEDIHAKPKYADRTEAVEPIEFLKQYDTELRQGTLTAGALQLYDRALYSALERRAAKMEGKPTVQQYFDTRKDNGFEGTPTQRKYQALATIMQTTREKAAALVGSMRPERVPPEIGADIAEKPERSR